MEGEAVTWDKEELEKVAKAFFNDLALGLMLYGQGFIELPPLGPDDDDPRFVNAPVTREIKPVPLKAVVLKLPKDDFMAASAKAELKEKERKRLQAERRANQQHFRHRGAKR